MLLGLGALVLLTACEGTAGPTGPKGADGASCSVTDNNDGTKTIACPGSPSVTIANGKDGSQGDPGEAGTSCTVKDNGDGTSTISCTDNTKVVVKNGEPCSAVDNGDGTKTLTCPGGDPIVLKDGTSCSVVDNGNGTAVLSCSDGSKVVIAPPMNTHLGLWEDLPGVNLTILAIGGGSNADKSFAPGDHIGVTFKVTTTAGALIPLHELNAAGIWVAGPTSNYQHIIPSTKDAVLIDDVLAKSTLNDDGSYTYTFADPIPDQYGVPINDTTKFTDGELKGPLDAGTYTVAMVMSKDYYVEGKVAPDANSATFDFGLNTAMLDKREVVALDNCNACHVRFQMHEGQFKNPSLCVTCHTSGAEDDGSTDMGDKTPVSLDFRVMVHKIHNGAHLPSVQGLTTDDTGARVYGTGTPYVIGTKDYSGINFPSFPNYNIAMPRDTGYSTLTAANKTKEDNVRKGVTSCFNCHGDPDGVGPQQSPAQGDVAYTAPSRRACGACHDDIDFSKPYAANGTTMPANPPDAACNVCHSVQGAALSVKDAHVHPVLNAKIAPTITVNLTSVSPGSGPNGNLMAGDGLSVNFTIKDSNNADVPINYFDSFSLALTGPTKNRQVVIPGTLTASPFDITGRLNAASTTNKGIMSKVYPTASPVTETFLVDFTSATAFNVSGTVSGALGGGVLPGSPGTYPNGGSVSNIVLKPNAVAQNITVAFTSPTAYTVTGSVSGGMGSGNFPASLSNTQRFTSLDGTVAFNIVLGATAPAAGNSIYMTVFKGGAANPVLFAIVGGRTAFAAGDRFYFDFIAPAPSYALKVPMDLQFEYLGDADGSPNQVLTAANLPVYYGRQTLLERTALVGAATVTTAAVTPLARFVYVGALDAGLASNDYIVIDEGTPTEEYSRVSGIDAATKRIQTSWPLRYAHGIGATLQEATLVYRQEGAANYYTLNPANGTITLNAPATVGNAFILTYRTDGRFGWKRKAGDALQAWYFAPLQETLGLDETWGDWRGKPLVDGTYTVGLWGYRSVELSSGAIAPEWQTYRDTTASTLTDFLFGATATDVFPYSKISDTDSCNGCHDYISFHGGGRLSADTCLMCHATPGPAVNYRTVLHEIHAETFPAFPNGAAECQKCHGQTNVFSPTNRSHPSAQGKPALDWTIPCTGCHSDPAALAHADTMTSSKGVEACVTCHGTGKDLDAKQVHKAR
ncbi:MAG: hypothetical protein U0359_20875 [Byssovorax sp.]